MVNTYWITNKAYTDLGIAFMNTGQIEKAMDCLQKSWRIYPCPHNMSNGLSTRLSRALYKNQSAQNIVNEYAEMNNAFRSR